MNEPSHAPEIKVPWQVSAVTSPLLLWAIVYSVRNRTLADFIRHCLYITTPLLAAGVLFSVVEWWNSGPKRRPLILLMPFMFAVLLAILSPLCYAVAAAVKDAYLWTQSAAVPKTSALICGVSLMSVLGAVLFYFRLRWRSVYGATEAVVGAVVVSNMIGTQYPVTKVDVNFYVATLTAGVYLVVQGLDSIHEGLTGQPRDEFTAAIIRWARNHF